MSRSAAWLRYTTSPASSTISSTAGALSSAAISDSRDCTSGWTSAAPRRDRQNFIIIAPYALTEADRHGGTGPEDPADPAAGNFRGRAAERHEAAARGGRPHAVAAIIVLPGVRTCPHHGAPAPKSVPRCEVRTASRAAGRTAVRAPKPAQEKNVSRKNVLAVIPPQVGGRAAGAALAGLLADRAHVTV